MKAALLCLLAGVSMHLSAAGFDYGLFVYNTPSYGGVGDDENISYTASAVPWFSMGFGPNVDVFLSAAVTAEYKDEWLFYPDVYRFEAALRPIQNLSIRAGRVGFSDITGLVATGLFDGLDLGYRFGRLGLSFGAFYTGLLYEDTADITMTASDVEAYNEKLDWDDFYHTYFASRRGIFSLKADYPGLLLDRDRLQANILLQFDFNDVDDQAHTQYLLARYSVSFRNGLSASVEAGAELIEPEDDDAQAAFCFGIGGAWMVPGRMQDRLSLGLRLATGGEGDGFMGFLPVTTVYQGRLLKAKFSGLMPIELGYRVRLVDTLSAETVASYFIRTDTESFTDPELDNDSPLLGAELYGRVVWVPSPELSFTVGGGGFFPSAGQAYDSDAEPRWEVSLTNVISF